MTSSAIMTSSSASLGSPAGASSSQYLHPDYIQMMPSSVSIRIHLQHSAVRNSRTNYTFNYPGLKFVNFWQVRLVYGGS